MPITSPTDVVACHDARGRLSSETRTYAGLAQAQTLAYTYDAGDHLLTTTYPDGEVLTTGYTKRDLPSTLVSSIEGTLVDATTYSASGQVTQRTLGSGLVEQYTYDPLTLRLAQLKTKDGATNLQQYSYLYDDVGNVRRITDAANENQQQRFRYDPLDRLTVATTTLTGNGQYTESYAYDALGNITVVTDGLDSRAYTYGGTEPPAGRSSPAPGRWRTAS